MEIKPEWKAMPTAFGAVWTDGSKRQKRRARAEVVALELLYSIVEFSEHWEIVEGDKTEENNNLPYWQRSKSIRSTTFEEPIEIYPIVSAMNFIHKGDRHLNIFLGSVPVCIALDWGSYCAVSDGFVSFVLLAHSGWPKSYMPETFRKALWEIRRNVKNQNRQLAALVQEYNVPENFALPLTIDNINRFQRIQCRVRRWPIHDRMMRLGAYARQLEANTDLELEAIQRHLCLLMDSVAPRDIVIYLGQIANDNDAKFFEPILRRGLRALLRPSYESGQEVTEWTQIWL